MKTIREIAERTIEMSEKALREIGSKFHTCGHDLIAQKALAEIEAL